MCGKRKTGTRKSASSSKSKGRSSSKRGSKRRVQQQEQGAQQLQARQQAQEQRQARRQAQVKQKPLGESRGVLLWCAETQTRVSIHTAGLAVTTTVYHDSGRDATGEMCRSRYLHDTFTIPYTIPSRYLTRYLTRYLHDTLHDTQFLGVKPTFSDFGRTK